MKNSDKKEWAYCLIGLGIVVLVVLAFVPPWINESYWNGSVNKSSGYAFIFDLPSGAHIDFPRFAIPLLVVGSLTALLVYWYRSIPDETKPLQ